MSRRRVPQPLHATGSDSTYVGRVHAGTPATPMPSTSGWLRTTCARGRHLQCRTGGGGVAPPGNRQIDPVHDFFLCETTTRLPQCARRLSCAVASWASFLQIIARTPSPVITTFELGLFRHPAIADPAADSGAPKKWSWRSGKESNVAEFMNAPCSGRRLENRRAANEI